MINTESNRYAGLPTPQEILALAIEQRKAVVDVAENSQTAKSAQNSRTMKVLTGLKAILAQIV
jgi:hypothetical protein